MAKTAEDMPTALEDIEQDAQEVFADVSEMIDAVIILGQLDAVEIRNGEPRWTEDQRKLILKATDQVGDWEL
jgi:hypothetical protein